MWAAARWHALFRNLRIYKTEWCLERGKNLLFYNIRLQYMITWGATFSAVIDYYMQLHVEVYVADVVLFGSIKKYVIVGFPIVYYIPPKEKAIWNVVPL